jgi:hypothetical protein
MSQTARKPDVCCQRMSALPSLLKSPEPTIFHGVDAFRFRKTKKPFYFSV